MPWGDGTGPMGVGPRTGRGLGFCSGFKRSGYVRGGGLGLGRGRHLGLGRGWRWFWRTASMPYGPNEEYLRARLSALEKEAEYIRELLSRSESQSQGGEE